MKSFKIINSNRYDDILLVDLLCKHVHSTASKKAKQLLKYSTLNGYKYCQWGTVSNDSSKEYQLEKIRQMNAVDLQNAIRIVVCEYPFSTEKFIWADNLHTTIRHIRNKGLDVKLADVKYYVIEIKNGPVKQIINVNDSFDKSLGYGSVKSALDRYIWSYNKNILAVKYTVLDFINDNKYLMSNDCIENLLERKSYIKLHSDLREFAEITVAFINPKECAMKENDEPEF